MKRKIIYSCPFVPAEWVEAHAMTPSRIIPRSAGSSACLGPAPGVCPYARAFANAAISDADAAAVIVTTTCDQMRRTADVICRGSDLPVFLMNVPHTWQTPGPHRLYASELRRLGRSLVRIGGEPPSLERLGEVMLRYEAGRSSVRDARGSLSSRAYSELIADFHRTGKAAPAAEVRNRPASGVPLALVGGPLFADHFDLFDLVEQAGGYVALDATDTGERTLPARFDRRALRNDPLGALADAYFGTIPDAFRRPNSELYRWLQREMESRGVRGIIYRRCVWCDTWHAEAHRMKQWAGLPFFQLDVGDDGGEQFRTLWRLQSFVEMLR